MYDSPCDLAFKEWVEYVQQNFCYVLDGGGASVAYGGWVAGWNTALQQADNVKHPTIGKGMPLSCAVVGCDIEGPHSHNEDCNCKQA